MANKITKFLGNVVQGIFSGEGDMRDYQHAARLFTDNTMALAPKVGFLYHVYFGFDGAAAKAPTLFGFAPFGFSKGAPQIECGMLCKNVTLPGIQVNTETKNQYGKKTNIQTGIQYSPVTFTFHDDNSNVVSGMWEQYFKANYADSQYVDALQQTTTYSPNPAGPFKFGLDNFRSRRFFNEISIYQLSRQKFKQFELINPMVQSWTPPTHDASSSAPAENQMVVIYEGIRYAEGSVRSSPGGFSSIHYDKTPSPLSIMGGGGGGLFGAGGVIAGGLDVFGDLQDPNVLSNPFALIGTAIKAKNTIDNAKNLTKEGVSNEIENISKKAIVNGTQRAVNVMGANKFDAKKQTVASAGSSEIIGQIQTTSGETITDFADGTSEIKIGGSGEVIKVPPINQL